MMFTKRCPFSPLYSIYTPRLPKSKFWLTLNNQVEREFWFPVSSFAKVFPRKAPNPAYPEYVRCRLVVSYAPANFFKS